MTRRTRRLSAVIGIAVVAVGLRCAWHDWDEGHNLHPDERFLGMVVAEVELPSSFGEYLDTAESPLNPVNRGHTFYVYGDLPLMLTRAAAEGLGELHRSVCGTAVPASATADPPPAIARLCWPGGRAPAPGGLDGATRVGRLLSSLFDLVTVALLGLLAGRLWGFRAGATAAALGAVTVLLIQHAHFATVDATATMFATAALTAGVWAARSGGLAALVVTGLAAGLAAACRINLAPAVGLVPLAALAAGLRRGGASAGRGRLLAGSIAGVAVALVVFRFAMPYAFSGVVSLDPQWVESVNKVRSAMARPLDAGPPGIQWAGRMPLVGAVVNMVVWGMGLPLGLAAIAGWAAYAWRRVRAGGGEFGAFEPATLVWLWATLMVGWFGAQRVSSMRYLLPAYPALIALAAWLLTRRPGGGGGVVARPLLRRVAGVALPLVLAATAAWAWAFTAIYRAPHTRIEASRWLFDSVPSAPVLKVMDATGRTEVAVEPAQGGATSATVIPFRLDRDSELVELTVPRVDLVPAEGAATSGWLRVRVAPAPDGRHAVVGTAVPVGDGRAVAVDLEGAPVQAGAWSFVVLDGVAPGEGARIGRPVVVGEHWDDQLPLAVDGRDPRSRFRTAQIHSFFPDDDDKREHLLERLGEADLVVLSSNRVYASVPRLPGRWPLTTRFYRLLLAGELGFEVAAEFTSYPRIGALEFPDSETTGALGLDPDPTRIADPATLRVPLSPAEEAFSVYDHPRVLVLRKRDDFSLEAAAAALNQPE